MDKFEAIGKFNPANIVYSIEITNNFVRETGIGLPKKTSRKLKTSELELSHSLVFASAESFVLCLSRLYDLEMQGKTAFEKAEIVAAKLFRAVSRYQVSRAKYAIEALSKAAKAYEIVERGRKSGTFNAISVASKKSVDLNLQSRRDEVEDAIEAVEELLESVDECVGTGVILEQEWDHEDGLQLLSQLVDEIKADLSSVSDPIVSARKESREKKRLLIAVLALLAGITVGTIPSTMPESRKAQFWGYLASQYNSLSSGNESTSLDQEENVSQNSAK